MKEKQAALAGRLKEGCVVAKSELYEQYYNQLYLTAYKIVGNRFDAEDIVSEAFTKIYNKVNQLKDNTQLVSWCVKVVIRLCYTFVKSKYTFSDIQSYEIGREGKVEFSLDLKIIEKHIKELPPGYRSVLELYCYQQLSNLEVAERLQIEPGTVRSQLYKARASLRKKLKQEY